MRDLPYPVGSDTNTSLPDRNASIVSSCFSFSLIPNSLITNSTETFNLLLQHLLMSTVPPLIACQLPVAHGTSPVWSVYQTLPLAYSGMDLGLYTL